MSKQSNKVIALALVGACTFGVYAGARALISDETQASKHAVNQIWIDHVPRDDRDMIFHMVLLDHPEGKFGAFGHSSQWRHRIDVFRWQLQGDTLGMVFPQDRTRGQVGVQTWECEGEAPAPFELCMRLTGDKGRSVVLYSRRDWKIEPRDMHGSLADIAEDMPALANVLHAIEDGEAEQLGSVDLDDADAWPLADPF